MDVLQLIPYNKRKIIESKNVIKFINTQTKLHIVTLEYSSDINNNILESYKKEPHILVINFGDSSKYLTLTKIPRYPIFLDNIFYITPICIEQVNGFSNKIKSKDEVKINFIERIMFLLGAILSIPSDIFNVKDLTEEIMFSGIKDNNTNSVLQYWFTNHLAHWMTREIEINNVGWFPQLNQYVIDYVYKYYQIKNTCELGAYYGSSSGYIANKNKHGNFYTADFFDNIMNTNYIVEKLTPLDTNYFFRYNKFESLSAKLSDFNNVYTIKNDCYKVPSFLHENNVNIDLFYIDFCKNDKKLIKFVKTVFSMFPNCIIVGDDAVHLKESLVYFEKNYNYIFAGSCYICSYKTKLVHHNRVKKYVKSYIHMNTTENLEELQTYDKDYQIHFIVRMINKKIDPKKIIENIKILQINPNEPSRFCIQYGNIFHVIGLKYRKDKTYYKKLYGEITKLFKDVQIKNNLHLTPKDYFDYDLSNFQ